MNQIVISRLIGLEVGSLTDRLLGTKFIMGPLCGSVAAHFSRRWIEKKNVETQHCKWMQVAGIIEKTFLAYGLGNQAYGSIKPDPRSVMCMNFWTEDWPNCLTAPLCILGAAFCTYQIAREIYGLSTEAKKTNESNLLKKTEKDHPMFHSYPSYVDRKKLRIVQTEEGRSLVGEVVHGPIQVREHQFELIVCENDFFWEVKTLGGEKIHIPFNQMILDNRYPRGYFETTRKKAKEELKQALSEYRSSNFIKNSFLSRLPAFFRALEIKEVRKADLWNLKEYVAASCLPGKHLIILKPRILRSRLDSDSEISETRWKLGLKKDSIHTSIYVEGMTKQGRFLRKFSFQKCSSEDCKFGTAHCFDCTDTLIEAPIATHTWSLSDLQGLNLMRSLTKPENPPTKYAESELRKFLEEHGKETRHDKIDMSHSWAIRKLHSEGFVL